MFEPKHRPLLPRRLFLRRFFRNFLVGLGLIAVSLAGGMAGYEYFEGMSTVDAFVNSAMILSGMGPIGELKTNGGKIFAGCYALYSGLALITVAAITLSPVFHRFLHRFHLEVHKDN
jgi:hypothetical protein